MLLVRVEDVARPFREHAEQIRRLNKHLAIHQRTEKELRKAVEASDLLKRELVHRVKNNLAVMSAMLRSQARSSKDAAVTEVLQEAANRVMSISVVHEILDETKRLSHVELERLIELMMDRIRASFCPPNIKLSVEVEQASVHMDLGLPLALLINELVTNAIKHAFEEDAEGQIDVSLRRKGSTLILSVSDNGVGMDHKDGEIRRQPRIVEALAIQLDAKWRSWVEEGTHWVFSFDDGHRIDSGTRPSDTVP